MGIPLILRTDAGLYCPAGDFHIDPWNPVPRAVITHAHGDHARPGSDRYLAAASSRDILRHRLGVDPDTMPYGQSLDLNGVRISFHPAGHVLGSAQVRMEHQGEVWVVSGDYKLDPDPTCASFEPVRCNTFITESTFGLPIYRWKPAAEVFDEMNAWWRGNQAAGKTSIVFAYSLGKAQRMLSGLDSSIGPIFTHGAVENVTRAYRECGVSLPETVHVGEVARGAAKPWIGGLVLAPPSAAGTPGPASSSPRQRVCLRMDAGPRHAAAAGRGPGLRPLRSRRLARAPDCDPGHRCGTRAGHTRLRRRAGPPSS